MRIATLILRIASSLESILVNAIYSFLGFADAQLS